MPFLCEAGSETSAFVPCEDAAASEEDSPFAPASEDDLSVSAVEDEYPLSSSSSNEISCAEDAGCAWSAVIPDPAKEQPINKEKPPIR
jgi:hypothetical protein